MQIIASGTMHLRKQLVFLSLGYETTRATSLDSVSRPSTNVIPSWHIQSTAKLSNDIPSWSRPDVDVSSWYHVNASRCTLMGCLLESGVYNDSDLFFSQNLEKVDGSQFAVPWLYRHVFSLTPIIGQHYFLRTTGISSRADIFLNGQQIATKDVQAGSYVGHTFDITRDAVPEQNALLVQVYPTDYNYDFALGFVDWNPYPPDNGTGVWRDMFLKQTGPVSLTPLLIVTDLGLPVGQGSAYVTLKATAENLEDREVTVLVESAIAPKHGGDPVKKTETVKLEPLQSIDVNISTTLENPSVWWPKAWGDQPLYEGQLSVSVDDTLSDSVKQNFGIRKVTSKINGHGDVVFSVNGQPFQVIGGGYSSDMFLRWDPETFTTQVQYMLDLGHNTVRLEGKMEHPELYDIADRMGMMILAGWECCDKWEAWSYNEDLGIKDEWSESDYGIANASMRHEAAMLQTHPSVLGFLVGSDYWPNDRATSLYMNAFKSVDWQNPVIASASKRGYPKSLGTSGMKMAGPYDWIPPNYWYDIDPQEDRLGAAFGFGSELGAGVGTPELSSLRKFLSQEDMDDLWKNPKKGLYHMSTNVSSFYTREIYNDALWKRLGAPTSLDDYLMKASILDYEATRSQFEAFSAFWNADQPATGLIYWMLNNAWPSLHWNLFDYYMHPAASYFGAKTGSRIEHVAYDCVKKTVNLINHSLDRKGARTLAVDILALDGKEILAETVSVETEPNTSKEVYKITIPANLSGVVLLRLLLSDDKNATLSRNVYWFSTSVDTLDWENSDWFFTPVTKHANFTALNSLGTANISATVTKTAETGGAEVVLENPSSVPAFFVSLHLVDPDGQDVLPVFWSDNYVSLWPGEKLSLNVKYENVDGALAIYMRGNNIAKAELPIA